MRDSEIFANMDDPDTRASITSFMDDLAEEIQDAGDGLRFFAAIAQHQNWVDPEEPALNMLEPRDQVLVGSGTAMLITVRQGVLPALDGPVTAAERGGGCILNVYGAEVQMSPADVDSLIRDLEGVRRGFAAAKTLSNADEESADKSAGGID